MRPLRRGSGRFPRPRDSAVRAGRRRRWQFLGALTAAVVGLCVSAAGAQADFAWASPTLVDNQPPYTHGIGITGISCPSTSLCVAVDTSGDVLTSTDPSAGFAAWTITKVVDRPIDAIACPTTTLCVAASDGVLVSTDPAGGASAWSEPSVGGGPYFSVSCASATACVAVGGVGIAGDELLSSGDPAGGSAAWHFTELGGEGLSSVSCTSTPTLFCAGVGGSDFVTSSDPLGDASKWLLTDLPNGARNPAAISCPTASLCVYGGLNPNDPDPQSDVVTSTDPGAAAPSWTAANVDSGNAVAGVSCASASLCFAFDSAGGVLTSSNPAGGTAAWATTPGVDAGAIVQGIACPSASFCIAGDSNGDVLATTSPTGAASSWAVTSVDGTGGTIDAVSCVAAPQCVAVDAGGNVITTADPAGGASKWHLANVDGADTIFDVSCASAAECVAVDAAGNALSSTDPTGGAAAWSVANVDGTNVLTGVSCPSSAFCVAVDAAGNVLTSADPNAGAGHWSAESVDPGNAFLSVSCASQDLCVAVDDAGNVATSTDPAAGPLAWTVANIDGTVPLNGVSCAPGTTLCVAAPATGGVLATSDPVAGSAGWLASPPLSAKALNWVSCASVSLCVAVGDTGSMEFSLGPFGTVQWVPSLTGESAGSPAPSLLGVSCSSSFCVAVDDDGNAIAGTPPAASRDSLDVRLTGAGNGAVAGIQSGYVGPGITCPIYCLAGFAPGSSVTLTATPTPGSQFAGWTGGGCGGTGSCTLTMSSDQLVTADFEPVSPPTPAKPNTPSPAAALSIVGAGSVVAGGVAVATCPGLCSLNIAGGSIGLLTAAPASGWTFEGWSGDCSGTGACQFVTGHHVTATFIQAVPSAATAPAALLSPLIEKVTIGSGRSVRLRFAAPTDGALLQCALVRLPTRKHARAPVPHYQSCGTVKTYRHLARGTYRVYVRAALADGESSAPVARRFTVR